MYGMLELPFKVATWTAYAGWVTGENKSGQKWDILVWFEADPV